MRKALFLFCGLCWFAAAAAIGIFLFGYLAAGAGFQDSGYVFLVFAPAFYSGSVLFGFVHVLGLSMFSLLCLVLGFDLCLRAFEPRPKARPPKFPSNK